MSLELLTTKDGSHTLLNTEINDTYHSIHGAIQESNHVFIDGGLKFILKNELTQLNILEVGFGTGLNAYLTLLYQRKLLINYTAIETFPLPKEIYEKLNYPTVLKGQESLFRLLHSTVWDKPVNIESRFELTKIRGEIENTGLIHEYFDLIYFDAFAPGKQPEIWGLPILEKITKSLKQGGCLITYCAQGQFKRDLKTVGFNLELLPGPPGKFEIVRAVK